MWNFTLLLIQIFIVIALTLFFCRKGKEILMAWMAILSILANLFVLKEIELFSIHVTCSDAFAIGCVFGLNLLQEFFGKESARKALWVSFFGMGAFAIFARLHLLFLPSSLDTTQMAYAIVLAQAPRLLCASLGSFFVTQWIDVHFFAILRNRWIQAPLWLRNGGSLMLSQLLDTSLFTFVGLWGIVQHLGQILFFSFGVKCAIILFLTPLLAIAQQLLKLPRSVSK